MAKTSCKKGQYYCNTDKKCKPIPDGYKVREDGILVSEGSLRKWFKGSKSKDGKGGWVNVVTGGTCASDEPGEGTPKCVSSAKRASMSKKERLSAARRKKRADPNQQSKRGAAKPTYVSTDKKKSKKKKKKMKEEFISLPLQLEVPQSDGEFKLGLMFRESLEQDRGMLFIFESTDHHSFHMKNTFIPLDIAFINEEGVIESIKELNPMSSIPVYPNGKIRYAVEVNRGWFAENGVVVGDILLEDIQEHHKKDADGNTIPHEGEELNEVKDKKGKGSGTKDACYHKVKSRYSVWPSAYASGALVKCRKVGAANWGNSTKKEEYVPEETNVKDMSARDIHLLRTSNKISRKGDEYGKPRRTSSGVKGTSSKVGNTEKQMAGHSMSDHYNWRETLDEKCWKGYEKKGMKTMFGKRYPNCVKKTKKEELEVDASSLDEKLVHGNFGNFIKGQKLDKKKEKKYTKPPYEDLAASVDLEGDFVSEKKLTKKQIKKRDEIADSMPEKDFKKRYGDNYKDVMYGAATNLVKDEYLPEILDKKDVPHVKKLVKKLRDGSKLHAKQADDLEVAMKENTAIESELVIQDWNVDDIKYTEVEAVDIIKPEPLKPSPSNWRMDLGEDWQSVNRKDKTDGMSKKAVKAYRKENPGSKLKTAVTKDPKKLKKGSKSAKRRLSFCRRMKGMKKKLTSAKTSRDPDSRINKALRRWNC